MLCISPFFRALLSIPRAPCSLVALLFFVLVGGFFWQKKLRGGFRNRSVDIPLVSHVPSSRPRDVESVKVVGRDRLGNVYVLRSSGKVEVKKGVR